MSGLQIRRAGAHRPPQARRARHVVRSVLAGILLLSGLVAVVPSAAALGTSTFEGADGNLVADEGTDWGSVGIDCPGKAGCKLDRPSGAGDDSFGAGVKEDDVVVQVVGGAIPNNKSDLTRFYSYGETAGSSRLVHLAWARVGEDTADDVSGTTNIDIELNQQVQTAPGPGSGNGTTWAINRTPGDLLLTFQLSKGGTVPTLTLYTWRTSGPCEASGSAPCWGARRALTAAEAEGRVNLTAVVDPVVGGTIAPFGFGEATLDITALLPPPAVFDPARCVSYASAWVKSRSSNTFGSKLKDFIAPVSVSSVSNCGEITISKTATNATGTTAFAFDVACPGAADRTVTVTVPGSTTVSERVVVPAGATCTVTEQALAGWQLVAPVPAQVTDGATISFTNRPLGSLTVTKTVSGDGPAGQTYPFHVVCDGHPLGTGAGFSLGDGDSRTITGIPAGTSCAVTETDAGGATVAMVDSTAPVTDGIVTIPALAGANVGVTNRYADGVLTGGVVVTKAVTGTRPTSSTGDFAFSIACGSAAPTTFELPAGGSQVFSGIALGTSCAVEETDDKGATSTAIADSSGAATDGIVTVSGDAASVTFTNDFVEPLPVAATCGPTTNVTSSEAALAGTLVNALASSAWFQVAPVGGTAHTVAASLTGTQAGAVATSLDPATAYEYRAVFTLAGGGTEASGLCTFTTSGTRVVPPQTPPPLTTPPGPDPDPVTPGVSCTTPSAVTEKGARVGATMTNGTASSVRFVLSDGTTVVDRDGADGWGVELTGLLSDEDYTYTATFRPSGLVASGNACGFRTKQATVVLPIEQTRPDIPVDIGDPATATRPPQVLGEVFTRPPVGARPSASTSGTSLARTGTDTGRLTALGMLLILGGIVLLAPLRVRRRTV